jgi:hypothetical protein
MPEDRRPPIIEIGWLCVDCLDPRSLGSWWQSLIGGEISVDSDGDVRLQGGTVPILFLGVAEKKQVKNRLHVDLDVDDYPRAVASALELGATPADDVFITKRWRVFRDPEGNEFCIIRPRTEAG